MKIGYRRLLIFQIIIFIILLLNSFVSSILTGYKLVFFLSGLLLIFKLFLGFEKDRHRYTKDILLEVVIFLLLFFFFYYILGFIVTYVRTPSYYSLYGIFNYIIPLVITICLKEILRYMMIVKSQGNKLLIITTVTLFVLLDITNSIYYNHFVNNYDVFLFVALTFLPAISTNIACSFITYKVGYKPAILYQLAIQLFPYILPIIPNPNEYVESVIRLLVPVILAYRINVLLKRDKREIPTQDQNKRRIGSLVLPGIIIVFLVYMTSGYFHYYAVAIASDSMNPEIQKGDVVIIEKIDGVKDLKLGQIIAYKYGDILIVHRLINKLEVDGEDYFYTKGDANEIEDGYPITEDMIVGIVNVKVPYLGLPTVLLNEL